MQHTRTPSRKARPLSSAPLPSLDPAFFDAAQTARAWPFEEARKLVRRLEKSGKGEALFDAPLVAELPNGMAPHAGMMRRVYPGFLQLTAFMSMNPERHKEQFKKLYQHIVDGETDKAETIRSFYDEYLAVNDLPAEFYLETVERVFQTYDLPRGALTVHGRTVNPAAIRKTALITVEGERDDICSVGQTVAAQDLCPNIRPYLKTHHLQPGVGHYGVFSGSKWNAQIYPRVREAIHAAAELH